MRSNQVRTLTAQLFCVHLETRRVWSESENGPTQAFMQTLRGLHQTIDLPAGIQQLAQQIHGLRLPCVSVYPSVIEHLWDIGHQRLVSWLSTGDPLAAEFSAAFERMFHKPLVGDADCEENLHSIVDDTLGMMCSKAYGVRKRRKSNSYSLGRADFAVEVAVDDAQVVVFRGEEEHVHDYRPGHPELDPVEKLVHSTPWNLWEGLFGDYPTFSVFMSSEAQQP